jgi:beta-xylosidase
MIIHIVTIRKGKRSGMKNRGSALILLLTFSMCFATNPILKDQGFPFRYTADPSAHVFEGKVYVYPSHDQDNAAGYNMIDYYIYSSTDLVKWTDEGKGLAMSDVPWVKEYMWAPDCAFKDGTYYLYFPARGKDGKFMIGVATSTKPAGPFKPEATAIPGSSSVDPAVFIDDDGKAYMYYGGDGDGGLKSPLVVKLNDNMKEFDGTPKQITGIQYWFEACWMHKYNNTYYLSYSTGSNHPGAQASELAYATATNPMGPFTYKGIFMPKLTGWTNHHSIIKYQDKWYLFYHTADRSGVDTKRDLCIDYLTYNADGTIKPVTPTKTGVSAVTVHSMMPQNTQSFQKNALSFNQSAINYTLAQAGMVELKILNPAGQLVMSLVNGFQSAKQYSIPLASTRLPGGLYYLSLHNGNNSEVKPLIITLQK